MRLLTHNFLKSTVKGTTKGYPLEIEATEVLIDDPPSPVVRPRETFLPLFRRINYPIFRQAAQQLLAIPADASEGDGGGDNDKDDNLHRRTAAVAASLPDDLPDEESLLLEDDDDNNNNTLLATLHHILMDVHLIEGFLICPDTGRRFPVKDSIPNMILHADEI